MKHILKIITLLTILYSCDSKISKNDIAVNKYDSILIDTLEFDGVLSIKESFFEDGIPTKNVYTNLETKKKIWSEDVFCKHFVEYTTYGDTVTYSYSVLHYPPEDMKRILNNPADTSVRLHNFKFFVKNDTLVRNMGNGLIVKEDSLNFIITYFNYEMKQKNFNTTLDSIEVFLTPDSSYIMGQEDSSHIELSVNRINEFEYEYKCPKTFTFGYLYIYGRNIRINKGHIIRPLYFDRNLLSRIMNKSI
jgi:hypothetical protein